MPRHFQQNILYTELYILQMLFFTGNPLSCTIERPGRARSNPGLLLPNCITLEEAPYLAESPLSGSRRGAKTARTKGDLSCYLRGVCMQQYVVRTLRQDSRVSVPSQPLMVICDPRQVLLCFEVGFLTTKNGRDNPALLASHSSYKAINNMISGEKDQVPHWRGS